MRISQLAAETRVSVPSIKFYLREGLLHDGALTSATQADYDDSHVRRLKLVRALLGPGGLTVAGARDLLGTLENPPARAHDLLGAALSAGAPKVTTLDPDLAPIQDLVTGWGWNATDCDPRVLASLGDALERLRDADFTVPDAVMQTYVESAMRIAQAEVAGIPQESAEAAVRYVVLGTILVEPLLLALRRLAEEVASLDRFGDASLG